MGARRTRAGTIAGACLALLFAAAPASAAEPPNKLQVDVCVDEAICIDPVTIPDAPVPSSRFLIDACSLVNDVRGQGGASQPLPLDLGQLTVCEQDEDDYLGPKTTAIALEALGGEVLSLGEEQFLSHGNRFWNSNTKLRVGAASLGLAIGPAAVP